MGGLAASPHYVAAKGGTLAFVKWLARKAADSGVTVNSVAPGATATAMVQGADLDANRIPLRRMAQPREIALPIAFLCSDGASYICGATLDVNGGVYMN
ncbi:3-oxoacyl-[acyl-carrier-protein] reductase FabG [compost metagenome]